MYKISRTDYGIHVFMGGLYDQDEMKNYVKEKEDIIASIDGEYSIIVDLRTAIPPKNDDANILKASHRRINNDKLQRIAIIISSPIIKLNATQVTIDSGINNTTRIIDASKDENWEELALNWVKEAIEPAVHH